MTKQAYSCKDFLLAIHKEKTYHFHHNHHLFLGQKIVYAG